MRYNRQTNNDTLSYYMPQNKRCPSMASNRVMDVACTSPSQNTRVFSPERIVRHELRGLHDRKTIQDNKTPAPLQAQRAISLRASHPLRYLCV